MASQTEQALQAEINRLKLHLHSDDATRHVRVGDYLLQRLEQLGVTSMFGVPGDFNLGFLDLVEDHPSINWIGNCNELNAAYAADGYARVKPHSIGVLLTTFGVGELSAMNGIAGAFSEMVPILHIVGVPSTMQQKTRPMLHHTLGDGRYDAYEIAAEQFTIAQAVLRDKASAPAEIDRILTACITRARPVYLALPTNLVYETVPASRLSIPLSRSAPPNDPAAQTFVLDEICTLVEKVLRDPTPGDIIYLVDACAIRHDVITEVDELINKTGFPAYSAPMGKSAVDERYERFGGIYVGSISHPEIKEKVEDAKLIISIGALKSDFNTGNFTYRIPTESTIELHSDHTKVQYATFPGIGMKELIPRLTDRLSVHHEAGMKMQVTSFSSTLNDVGIPPSPAGRLVPSPSPSGSQTLGVPGRDDELRKADAVPRSLSPEQESVVDPKEVISHEWFWMRMGRFFKEKDVIVAETGTSSFGILDVPLPDGATFVSQILWGSIGWTVGSTLGAALAARELGLGRTILFIGDGSLQLTVQELSTMLRTGVKPIIFVLNNKGYTIERYLHGWERKYNDILNWSWTSLLTTLGDASGTKSKSYTARTRTELEKLLGSGNGKGEGEMGELEKGENVMQLVEVIMEKHDAPAALQRQAELSGKMNRYVA